jgi:hypothetical protein
MRPSRRRRVSRRGDACHTGAMPRLLVLPSPLLPGSVHEPLAEALESRGWHVVVADVPASASGPEPVLQCFSRAVARVAPDLVMTHSNAGRYAAHVTDGIPVVHVDAALPDEGGRPTTLAPEAMLRVLADLAGEDGTLPPWTRWWPDEAVAEVLPDRQSLSRLRDEEWRMPLSYFRAHLDAPQGWAERPQAYLAFGDTYADEVALARRHGWPVEVLEGTGHLHSLVAPDQVATRVIELAARLS